MAPNARRSFSTRHTKAAVVSRGFIGYNAQIWCDIDEPNSNSTLCLKLDQVVPTSMLGAVTAHAAYPSMYIPVAAIAVAFNWWQGTEVGSIEALEASTLAHHDA